MAEHYYSVAKAYMLYRQKHLEDREVRDKLKFLMDYCDASNPASGSKYDANANVENKNIATLIGELPTDKNALDMAFLILSREKASFFPSLLIMNISELIIPIF